MHSELTFVPKILLCGDEAEFFARVGNRPYKLVGHLEVFGIVNGQQFNLTQDGRVFFGGKLQEFSALRKLLAEGAVDFVIFNNLRVYSIIRNYALHQGFVSTKIITVEFFKVLPVEFFYDIYAEQNILAQLKNLNIRTLLDVDGYFARGQLITKPEFTEIDCITDEPLPPVTENIYTHTYKDFAQVGFKRYDAALIIEREPQDFFALFAMLENYTDFVITFARNGSDLVKYLLAVQKRFANLRIMKLETVTWFLIERRTKPQDFCVYVVTHKTTPHEGKLPEGYKQIHAGRALKEDLGYLGDNTGDNISRLNPYINEITALYWFWKNTAHEIVGLSHYRRFFTVADNLKFSYDKILTRDAALELLDRYDIITSTLTCEMIIQRELIQNDCGKQLAKIGEEILRKNMLKSQPDYIDVFDVVMNSMTFYKCNMFITRRNVFDAYCKWLFSFFIDATEEILRTVDFDKLSVSMRRVMGFFSERMMTVWIRKNRLRIKELEVMFISDI